MDSTKVIASQRIERARELFQEFRPLCFWSWPDDLEITERVMPQIIRGLRTHGGHRGYRAASELCR